MTTYCDHGIERGRYCGDCRYADARVQTTEVVNVPGPRSPDYVQGFRDGWRAFATALERAMIEEEAGK